MAEDQCPVCERPESDECGCNPLHCPVCDKAVSWFGESYGMNPCDHVVVWGTVGEEPVWENDKVRKAFLAFCTKRRKRDDYKQDAIEAYVAKHATLISDEHDAGGGHGRSQAVVRGLGVHSTPRRYCLVPQSVLHCCYGNHDAEVAAGALG